MKNLHIHLHTEDLESSVIFYNRLFNHQPSVLKPDYAKWMLDDPSVNFSISLNREHHGVAHLGIQAEDDQELKVLYQRLDAIEGKRLNEGDTECCYAQSRKSWIEDPQKVSWEIFHTYGESAKLKSVSSQCCASDCCTETV